MLEKGNAETGGNGIERKVLPFVLAGMVALLAFRFTQLDESKKRFIMHLLRQAPYLPGRYFA